MKLMAMVSNYIRRSFGALNKAVFLGGFFPLANLLFMHFYIRTSDLLEWRFLYSDFSCFFSSVFDVSLLTMLFLLITKLRTKPAAALTFCFTWIWSLVNVFYARFFYQYMSISAFGEAGRINDSLVVNSIIAEIKWHDLFFPLVLVCFVFLYRRTPQKTVYSSSIKRLFFVAVFSVIMSQLFFSVYHFMGSSRNNWELYAQRSKEIMGNIVVCGTTNLAHYHAGCIRPFVYELYDLFSVTELSEEERSQIASFYKNEMGRTSHRQHSPQIENVIFVILESFLTAPIDLFVDGKEITPFLNSLKNDSSVYYNGNMVSDIAGGESGDGQFIYMNGLLPLRHKVTVGEAKKKILPSLPRVLTERIGISNTEIYVPTMPNMWQQADLNVVYGIKKMYSLKDIIGDSPSMINDQNMFEFAARKIDACNTPFLSIILSLSTHSPYDKFVGNNYLEGNASLPTKYRNYLNTCHYTDEHLGAFVEALRQKGVYDNSLIVICADHYAHTGRMDMTGKISSHTPLFIIHGDIDRETAWGGEFHQLDIYTTLLDLLGIDTSWKGLGHTILSGEYENSVTPETYDISRMIIEGDYFRNM